MFEGLWLSGRWGPLLIWDVRMLPKLSGHRPHGLRMFEALTAPRTSVLSWLF